MLGIHVKIAVGIQQDFLWFLTSQLRNDLSGYFF